MLETITFYTSKIFWALAAPSHFFVFLLLLGFLPFFPRLLKRVLRGLSAFFFMIMLAVPVGEWALLPLEACYEKALPPTQVDGVIVLGGGISERITEERKSMMLSSAANRLLALVMLLKDFPQAKLVYTGGSGSVLYRDFHEADYAKQFLDRVEAHPERLIRENQSRNTYENALYTKPFFAEMPGQSWLIVTSAFHMPRAMGLFEQIGKGSSTRFFPYVTDFKTIGRFRPEFRFDLPSNLEKLDMAVKEYIGLFFNHLMGHSQKLWPCGQAERVIP